MTGDRNAVDWAPRIPSMLDDRALLRSLGWPFGSKLQHGVGEGCGLNIYFFFFFLHLCDVCVCFPPRIPTGTETPSAKGSNLGLSFLPSPPEVPAAVSGDRGAVYALATMLLNAFSVFPFLRREANRQIFFSLPPLLTRGGRTDGPLEASPCLPACLPCCEGERKSQRLKQLQNFKPAASFFLFLSAAAMRGMFARAKLGEG